MKQSFTCLFGFVLLSILLSDDGGKVDAAPTWRRRGADHADEVYRPTLARKRSPPLDIATVLETPLAASLFDPTATWKAPLVPAGKFNPMPLIATMPLPPDNMSASKPPSSNVTKPNASPTAPLIQANSTNSSAPSPSSSNSSKTLSDAMLVNNDVIKGLVDSMTLASDSMNATAAAAAAPPQPPSQPALPMPDASKPDVPKPADMTALLRKKREIINRRSTKHQWSGMLKKRAPVDDKTKDVYCPSDSRETLVPVTFQELYEMKTGKSKLIAVFDDLNSTATTTIAASSSINNVTATATNATTAAAPSNATITAIQTPECINKLMSTVIVVPVSEFQMAAIDDGLLLIKSTEQRGVVTLVTKTELKASAASSVPSIPPSAAQSSSGTEADVEGPSFAVVPIDYPSPSFGTSKLPVFNTISGPDASKPNATASATNSQVNSTAPIPQPAAPKSNTNGSTPSPADATILGGDGLKRRSLGSLEPRYDESLQRRVESYGQMQRRGVKPSSADNTSIVGNGAGKQKYNHTIHYNAASDTFGAHQHHSMLAFFVVGTLYAWLCL